MQRKTTDIFAVSKFHNHSVKIRAILNGESYHVSARQYTKLLNACPFSECGCGIFFELGDGRALMPIEHAAAWNSTPTHYTFELDPTY